MDRGRGRPSRSRSNSRSRSRGRDRSRDRPSGARLADKRVYISNIPYDSRWQDIKDLFRQEVGEVAFVELFSDESDKPRGCGIIEFESAVSAKKAIEKMHRHELGGRKIVVKEDYDVERDKSGRIVTGSNRSGGGGGGGRERSRERENRDRDNWDRRNDNSPLPGNVGGGGKFGNTYGLSQQFLDSLGIDGPLISKVFISNLDFRVDDKKLKEVFRLAGRVLFVDINKDKDGKSRGHGTIEFEHPVEAVQAISMFNDQQLYERRMHVKMDRLSDPIADLAKNRLPDGLKSIGMGLGANGQPLVDVSRNLPSFNISGNSTNLIGGAGLGAALNNPQLAMNMNMSNLGMSQLASAMINPQAIDLGGGVGLSNAASVSGQAASNVFNVASGMGPLATLNTPNQFTGGPSGLSMNTLVGTPSNAVNVNALMGNPGGGGGSQGNAQQSFQNGGSGNQGPGSANFREIDYGYSASYNAPNVNTNVFQRDRQQFGGSGGGGGGQITNTVIVSNLPPSCTWQTLKAKFREYGEIVFAEKRDNNTGIVRFATERDAERAVKVFHQSRVDGRIVDVRFL